MLTNPQADRVRSVRGLSRPQGRRRSGLFLAEGPQAVREAVRWCPQLVRDLYVTAEASERHSEILAAARAAGLAISECSEPVLAAMADTGAPQGLLAVCRARPGQLPATLGDVLAASPSLLCVLTHVRDPGNAGTVIRVADAAGADAVLVSSGSVDVLSPKVVRASAGSLFHLPIVVDLPVEAILQSLGQAGIRRLAADGAGQIQLPDLPALVLDGPHAWVFGNEAWGMAEPVRAACDEVVRVPIHGRAESLNLGTAAAVCLYASAGVQRVQSPAGRLGDR